MSKYIDLTEHAKCNAEIAKLKKLGKCEVVLPKINAEIFMDFKGTGLFECVDVGYTWTQTAVDFACLLKSNYSKIKEVGK